ncbi:MAG TPA: polynucleotide adenylyltransferase PcnB, partial [Macromonas sp.]|nr:polynucleotide adenylyltransferase PcnB [Macromonas sp.]
APIVTSAGLLHDIPQSRLFDEMLKLLQTGHALASIEQLKATGLAKGIYPLLDLVVQRAEDPFVRSALQDTDRRVGEGKPVAPSFLLACVLWQDVRDGWNKRLKGGMPPFPALQESVDVVFDARIGDVSGRGKLGADMREIWLMQPRFDKRTGSSPFSLADQARFRAGFDFLRLRALVAEVEEELAHWWETFSTASDTVRQDMVDEIRLEQRARSGPKASAAKGAGASKSGGRGRVHRVAADGMPPVAEVPASPSGAEEGGGPEATEDDQAPAKKRRRRRRKPTGGAAGQGEGPDPDYGADA